MESKKRMREERKQQKINMLVEKPWSFSWEETAKKLNVSPEKGLNSEEIQKRRRKYGANRLRAAKTKPARLILLDQFKNPIVALLGGASMLAFFFGQWLEGLSILAAICINTGIGFFTEWRAVRSMEALHRMSRVTAKVKRNDQLQETPAENIVPGDVVFLEGGDIVSADLRLTEASLIQIDESALTGESIPAQKDVEPLEKQTPLAERTNMAFKGTAVTSGSGWGLVVATGMHTELGKIASLAEESGEEESPLEKRLSQMAYKLIWVTLAVAAAVAISGLLANRDTLLIIETAIALAVAAIPEGLPIVATIALARGMWRMARRNALMNRLSAVETLGATSIICTDKTGTLTENRMRTKQIALPLPEKKDIERVDLDEEHGFLVDGSIIDPKGHPLLSEALEIGVLCNNAAIKQDNQEEGVGDPMEVALLEAGAKAGFSREHLVGEIMPEVREEAFNPEVMMMATFHESEQGYKVAVKGAPEAVLNACSRLKTPDGDKEITKEDRDRWLDENNRLGEAGLRLLAAAEKNVKSKNADPYEDLNFIGLFGLLDPPREGIKEAISACNGAGIRVIMVTGDQAVTARHIGEALGLVDEDTDTILYGRDLKGPEDLSREEKHKILRTPIFARVSPEQKLDIIGIHRDNGNIVAMTGDGVNDAPALKKADIGIAMGKRGTQVAKEAADMVLKDDAFETILVAVQQGRAIFNNIRKFILFLLSGNVAEIMIVAAAMAAGAPLPILPLQILYLNLIGDVFPALALGVGKGDPMAMEQPPRNPAEPILTRGHWIAIGGWGALIAIPVLASLLLALTWLHMEESRAITVSFLTLAFARLWHVFNMRERESKLLNNDVIRNPFVWAALAGCTVLLGAAVYIPALSLVLNMVRPGLSGWTLIFSMSLVPLLIGQILKSAPLKPAFQKVPGNVRQK
jgi:P-type Ca2+ transporter type 2C